MNHDDGTSLALHHEMQIRVVDLNEQRFGARVIMRDPVRDVSFFESTGDLHDLNWTRDQCITSRSDPGCSQGEFVLLGLLAVRWFRRLLEGSSYIFRDVGCMAHLFHDGFSDGDTVAAHRADCLSSQQM